jgi:ABC-type multidrug transport system fused ATPase/permease subunit
VSALEPLPPPGRHPLFRALLVYQRMPWRFALCSVIFLVANLSLAWQQWLLGRAIHDVERGAAVVQLPDGGFDAHLAWWWLAVLIAVAAGRGLLQYLSGVIAITIGQELLFILRERILVQVQRLDLSYHWRHGVGELVTRTTRDADKLRDALVNFWRSVVETLLIVIAAVGILWWYDPLLGLVPALLVVTGLAILVRQIEGLVVLDRTVGEAYDRVNQELSEGVNGVRVIKAFGLEGQRIASFTHQVQIFVGHARAALAYAAVRVPGPQLIVALSQVWILGWGAHLVAAGRLNLGELVAALLVANTLVFRVEGINRVMQIFADARSSAARIWELLDAEPAILGGQDPLPSGPLGVRFSGVGVAAPGGGNAILSACDFTIRPGEIVAVVGMTGSGKSTLAGLLPRLVEADTGTVALGSDAAGWTDVRRLPLDVLRRQVHVVPQEGFLFSDSLAANLRLGAPQASDADLREALTLAAADEVVGHLAEGLATRIGDRGITLSGGQRQRICLARALLAKPAVLGLDDATSALDAVTERRVLNNLRRFGAGITVLVVASKLSTILLADRVLLLSGGQIAAQGTHAELADTSAEYRELLGLDHG